MKLQFFKPAGDALSQSDKELIHTLVSIKAAADPVPLISALTDADLAKVHTLVVKLGEKILKASHGDTEQFVAVKRKFAIAMNDLFKANIKFICASYSSQLLQYYTIISDAKFEPAQNTVTFLDFLADIKFGKTQNNLFITEYKLIKIYNDLSDLIDAKNNVIAPMSALEEQIPRLVEELNLINIQITKWLEDAPDNIFVHYLHFSVNYCFARVLELQFIHLKDSITEEDQLLLSDKQQAFFEQAQQAVDQISKLKEDPHGLKGTEFSFGQDVFYRVPAADFETVRSHIHSLTKS